MARKIMIIRHAEKPVPPQVAGVRESGEADPHSLSVRGWQRAGALIRFFAQPEARGIEVPEVLLAGHFDRNGPHASRRPLETVEPLARALGLAIDDTITRHQEPLVAQRCRAHPGVVLVSWHHEHIPALARAIAPDVDAPDAWPDECFDRVWVFEEARSGWKFRQVQQRLLAGDAGQAG